MDEDARSRTTELVNQAATGEERGKTPDELLTLVYDELRRLARGYLARERRAHTLQPTALVHEAYLRLVRQDRVSWQGKIHFLAVGAQAMRRILVDHARHRSRDKRLGDKQRVTLSDALLGPVGLDLAELIALDRALEELGAHDARDARIVELRYFGGLTVAEVADLLGVSKRTVEASWTHARAWLRRRLCEGSAVDQPGP